MDEDKIFEDLILSGALEPSGMDIDSGEMLYNFTDKLETVNPELHSEFSRYFSTEVYGLWENGFLDMDVTDKNPKISITLKALDPKQVAKLDKNKQYTLKEIIRIILGKE
jgi:hypothetical protein